MHMECFYAPPENFSREEVLFPQDESHHIRVVRKRVGDMVWAVDGQGKACQVRLVRTGKEALGSILNTKRFWGEPAVRITLAQAAIKPDRFDWLVEKATELGVFRILPVQTEKSEFRVGPHHCSRWQRIAKAAMKQCGRSVLPAVGDPSPLKESLITAAECRYRFIADAGGSKGFLSGELKNKDKGKRDAFLVVGPEGGFTEDEISSAIENGFTSVNLGERRLRSETAALVLLDRLMGFLGKG